MRVGDLDAAIHLIAGDSDGRQLVAAVARRQGKEPTATLTASSFDLDQFGGQGPSLPAVMARYDRTYALAHAATLILAVGAIYILLDACEPLPLFHRTIRKTLSGFRRGAGVCVAWCRFNAFMTAIRFAGGRLYSWICVIEFKSLVRDNFDRVGTYKKVFGSFGLMDVKRGGVGSILSYPMSQGSETRVYLSRHQRSRRDSQVRLMLEGHFACEPHSGCRSWRCSTRASG